MSGGWTLGCQLEGPPVGCCTSRSGGGVTGVLAVKSGSVGGLSLAQREGSLPQLIIEALGCGELPQL